VRDLMRGLVASTALAHARPLSPEAVRGMLEQLGEDERQAVKRLYREKKMRAAKTRDLQELIDWLGRTYDRQHYPKTVEQVMRRRQRPRLVPKK
jgi:hypothetical protein